MRLLGHLIAADVRHHRLMLGLWVAIAIASAIETGVRPLMMDVDHLVWAMALLGALLWWAWILLFVTMSPLIVQADPLVGSTAFWMTRPVPPMTLLASKAVILLTLLVLLPALADVPQMVVYSVPPSRVMAATVQTSFWLLGSASLLMALSALTETLPRFALLCASIVGVAASAAALTLAVVASHGDDPVVGIEMVQSNDGTSSLVMTVLLLLSAGALLSLQYRTRRRTVSASTGAAGLCVAILAASWWPWPLFSTRLDMPRHDGGSSVRLGVDPSQVGWGEWSRSDRAGWTLLQAPVRLLDLEPGWAGAVQAVDGAVQVAGGPVVQTAGPTWASEGLLDGDDSPTRSVMKGVLGVRFFDEPSPPEPPAVTLLATRENVVSRLADRSARYRGLMRVTLTRYAVEAVLPLSAGTTYQHGDRRFTIDSLEHWEGRLSLRARESGAITMFDREPSPGFQYVLRNRAAGRAIRGLAFDPGSLLFFGFGTGVGVSGFRVQRLGLTFSLREGGTMSPPLPDTWVRDAELVIVRTTMGGTIERPLEIPEFTLQRRVPPDSSAAR